MDIDEARRRLDALTLLVHQMLDRFEAETDLRIERVTVERVEISTADDTRPRTRIGMLTIEVVI